MRQLVTPNLSTVGLVGWCLKFVEDAYSTPHLGATATDAWHATQFPHTDALPAAQVPVWFSYYEGGENYGHVAINIPGQGVLSSPYKQDNTQQWFASIAQCEQVLNCKYLGWSEDLATVRLVEGETMTQDAVEKLVSKTYRVATDIDATPEQAGYWVSRIMADNNTAYELAVALGADDYKGDPQFRYKGRHYDEDMTTKYNQGLADGGGQATVLKPGKYQVT